MLSENPMQTDSDLVSKLIAVQLFEITGFSTSDQNKNEQTS